MLGPTSVGKEGMERKREREEGMVGEENEEGMGRKTVKICPPPPEKFSSYVTDENVDLIAVQGHPRSQILVPIESTYRTSYTPCLKNEKNQAKLFCHN